MKVWGSLEYTALPVWHMCWDILSGVSTRKRTRATYRCSALNCSFSTAGETRTCPWVLEIMYGKFGFLTCTKFGQRFLWKTKQLYADLTTRCTHILRTTEENRATSSCGQSVCDTQHIPELFISALATSGLSRSSQTGCKFPEKQLIHSFLL